MTFINRKHNKIVYIMFFSFFLINCQFKDPNKPHGINFLENRESILIVGETNKNDVIKLIGNPHSESIRNENTWIYFERKISRGKLIKLGQNVLERNNILELTFDKYGVLNNKKLYKKNDMQVVKYSKNTTKNNVTQRSFVGKFLSSVKEKMYGNRKKSNEQ